MKKTLPFILGLLLMPALGFAQTSSGTPAPGNSTSGQKTVEEKRLQSSVEVQVIAGLVSENGRGEKLRALDFIRGMIDKGKARCFPLISAALNLKGRMPVLRQRN